MLASLRQRLVSLGIAHPTAKAVLRAVVEGSGKLEGEQLEALYALAGPKSGVLKRPSASKAASARKSAIPSRYCIDPAFSASALNFYGQNQNAVPNVGFVPKAIAFGNEEDGRLETLDLDFFAKTHGHQAEAVKDALARVRTNGKAAIKPEHKMLLGQLERLGVIVRNNGVRAPRKYSHYSYAFIHDRRILAFAGRTQPG